MTTPAQVLPGESKQIVFAPRGLLALASDAYGQTFTIQPRAQAAEYVEPVATPSNAPAESAPQLPRVGVLTVRGPLMQHWAVEQSYAEILCRVQCLVSCGVERIAVLYDTPGGLVSGCFQTARAIRKLCDDAKIELYAFVEGTAASAGYALACVAHRVYCGDTSHIGSIGVIASLSEATKLDAALGMRYMLITSGDRKADGNPHIEISEGAISATQAHVDSVADLFFTHVAEFRPKLKAETLKALQAGTFLGAQALQFGFADAMCDFDDFRAAITAVESPIQKENQMTILHASKGYTAAVEALKAVNDDKDASDVEKAAVAKMLAAVKAEGDAEDDDKGKESAESSDDEDKDKDEGKEKAAAGAPALAAAAADPALQALAEVHTLRATVEAGAAAKLKEERKAKRAALLAGRPDFDSALRAKLSAAKLEIVEHYCATIPKGAIAAAPVVASLAASQAMPGMTEGAAPAVSTEQAALLKRMGQGQDESPRGITMVNGNMRISARPALKQAQAISAAPAAK